MGRLEADKDANAVRDLLRLPSCFALAHGQREYDILIQAVSGQKTGIAIQQR